MSPSALETSRVSADRAGYHSANRDKHHDSASETDPHDSAVLSPAGLESGRLTIYVRVPFPTATPPADDDALRVIK